MNYWEFLIQKEGDRAWLPLETQQVEVVAGRYRIAAHTDRTDAPLAIRLSPLAAEALPADSEVGIRKTDESGLVLVVPYVHLAPGQWLLECSSLNPANGLTGEDWHHSTQFQVHAHAEADGEHWPTSRSHYSGSGHGSDTAASVLMGSIDNAESQPTNKGLPLIQAQAALAIQQQSTSETAPDLSLSSAELAYQVSLRQRAYLAQHNQPTTIVGKVNAASKVEGLSEAAPEEASELWIRLQDPQTAQVIMTAHRPLSLARLPADFKVQIQLPAEVSTRIILGEVSLQSAAMPDAPPQLLASTAFTITAGIAHLLEAIADQPTNEFETDVFSRLESPEAASTEALTENSASADALGSLLLDPTKKEAAPAVGVILPPQLSPENRPAPSLAPSQPELPALPKPQTAAPSSSDSSDAPPVTISQPAQFIGTSILDDDLEADEISAVLENIGLGSLDPDKAGDSAPLLEAPDAIQPLAISKNSLTPDLDASADADSDLSPQKPKPPTQKRQTPTRQTDLDFQSLQLKNHFWQRLSTLTHESHKEATKMAEGMKAAGVSRESAPLPDELGLDLEDEVVIFDDPPVVASQSAAHQPQPSPDVPLSETGDQPSYALATQPPTRELARPEMALPVISVPIGDLVAGEFITVTVRTRPSAYRPLIKLWMVDRQSRSLVMEPQRLTNLRPDALGDLQATAKIQIPMDCLDVQIAAIAIDIATQQESGKAVVNRHVVPADQSSPLGSFNL